MKPFASYLGLAGLTMLTVACSALRDPEADGEALDTAEGEFGTGSMLDPMSNFAGAAKSATSAGTIDLTNPYFQSLGTNERTCNTCHLAGEGWSITPSRLRSRFDRSGGTDPIFRVHDAANSPNADVSTVDARRSAYSLLLARGVIRVGLPVKPTSDFVLVAAEDPHGFASAAQLSMFRRPLPTTNLRFLTVLNWDGRSTPAADLTNIRLGLKNQSNGATVNHAKATAPIDDLTRDRIVDFEVGLTTAQYWHEDVGPLYASGARGGPTALLTEPFTPGANDPSQPGFSPRVFTLFDAWDDPKNCSQHGRSDVARGQKVFNEKTFPIGEGRTGTCSGCHSMPNIGASSGFRFFDVGISSPARRASDVPLYTFQNIATGETIQTTDPGRALISGLWADMNRFKVPSLRGLASRAPYFHDGSARTIEDVVNHYEQHFGIAFGWGEKRNLVTFLESL
jgi:cytochrome c peroxidase